MLILLALCTWVVVELVAESQGANQAFFYFVVTGNGEGEIAGYFGWVDDPQQDGGSYSLQYVKVLSSADIQSIALLAEASGYETIVVTEPADYDPFPPRVAIRNRVVLYPNNVPINFTIIVLENGSLAVNVHSQYYIRDAWMRAVFGRMLEHINLPRSIISKFKLAENHLGKFLGAFHYGADGGFP